MKNIALFLCVVSAAFAAGTEWNLEGVVTNKNGQPISNAKVYLSQQGLRDTTGSDGVFSFTFPKGAPILGSARDQNQISIDRGVLSIKGVGSTPFLLEVFDLKGHLVKRVANSKTVGGIYRLNTEELAGGRAPLYYKIFRESRTQTFLALQSLMITTSYLEVAADGYQAKTEMIEYFSGPYTIVLDSAIKSTGSVGCGKSPTLVNGTRSVQSGGQSRQYILDIPSDYDKSHAYKLVFGFHWSGSNMTDVATGQTVARDKWAYYGLKALANNSTIFIAPQGLDAGWANTNGRDLVFTDDILKQVKTDLCIDTTRIFSVGFSYGGGMGYALACDRPDVFRAVAVQSGAQLSGCVEGKKPIAYFGASSLTETMGRGLGQKMAERNGCTAQEIPLPAAGSNSHICIQYQGCNEGYPVEWCTHTSGHQAAPYDGGAGDNADKTWVPGKVWSFFSQF